MMIALELYQKQNTWYGKVIVMEAYHLSMLSSHKDWTVTKTADYFGFSIGLVSENLRIAEAFHTNSDLINCKSRVEALRRLR